MSMIRPLPTPLARAARAAHGRIACAAGVSRAELALVAALSIGALAVGGSMIATGSDDGGEAAASQRPAATAAQKVDTGASAPSIAAVGRRTTASRLRTLRHPLVGVSRRKLLARLGPPTRRTIEGGAALELLEYEIADQEYQVVVLKGRVTEINRFR